METTPPSHTSQVLAHTSRVRAAIIGTLVIVLVLLLCALYLWGALLSSPTPEPVPFQAPPNHEPETPRADADIQILKTVSSSDEIAAIEADLNSTNLDSLDQELDLIDRDLGN